MRLNLNLKLAIVRSQHSQREIAAASNILENRFSSIVNGWVEPRPREREAIAVALGQGIDDLFDRAQDEQRHAAGRTA